VTKAVIVGCGNIASRYAEDILASGTVDMVGFYDVDEERAARFADEYGGNAFESLDQAIEAAELVLNLTIFESHYVVSHAALSRSRHVYSEKPLALRLEEAVELARLADANGVRLGAAPFTFLGEAQATALDWVRTGKLGKVRLAYAEVNHGRIETWHPNPAPFYEVGPMLDVGVYPLALLIKALGPVKKLCAIPSVIHDERIALDATPFTPGSPDYWLVDIEHAGGEKVRMTVNFYVLGDEGVTFHGDDGSLRLDSWFAPNSALWHIPYGGEPEQVEVLGGPDEVDWSVGVRDFVVGIENGAPSELTAELAVHMVAVLDAINQSGATGEEVVVEIPKISSP
jgi:predicted dehydrogenase